MYGNFLGSKPHESLTGYHLQTYTLDFGWTDISWNIHGFLQIFRGMIEAHKNQVTFDGSPEIVYNNEGNKVNDSSH